MRPVISKIADTPKFAKFPSMRPNRMLPSPARIGMICPPNNGDAIVLIKNGASAETDTIIAMQIPNAGSTLSLQRKYSATTPAADVVSTCVTR